MIGGFLLAVWIAWRVGCFAEWWGGELPTSCCRRCYRVSARAVVLSAGGQRARLQPQL